LEAWSITDWEMRSNYNNQKASFLKIKKFKIHLRRILNGKH